jgi:hypothetical protein
MSGDKAILSGALRTMPPTGYSSLMARPIPATAAARSTPRLDGTVYRIINSVFIQGTRESAIGRPSGITYAIPSRHVREMLQREKSPVSNNHPPIFREDGLGWIIIPALCQR